ncbi:MAG: hypothetical protein V4616_05650 [Bacteroidota bacterium]
MAEIYEIIRALCSKREEFFRVSNEYFTRRNEGNPSTDAIDVMALGMQLDGLRGRIEELEKLLEIQPNHINMDIWKIMDPGEGGWPAGSVEFFDKVLHGGGSITITSKTHKEPLIIITDPQIWEEVKQLFRIA